MALTYNMTSATQWNLLAAFIYWCLPAEMADYYSVTQVVYAISWAVAISISIIIFHDDQLIQNACADYSCPIAWTGHIIIHYWPPLWLTLYLYTHTPSVYLQQPYKRQIAAAILVSFVSIYCVYMDPLTRYKVDGCLLELAAMFTASGLAALVSLKLLMASVAN